MRAFSGDLEEVLSPASEWDKNKGCKCACRCWKVRIHRVDWSRQYVSDAFHCTVLTGVTSESPQAKGFPSLNSGSPMDSLSSRQKG